MTIKSSGKAVLALLQKQSNMQVVGEAEDGRQAVRLAAELQPAVVIIDIGMSDLNGIEATRQIVAEDPEDQSHCPVHAF